MSKRLPKIPTHRKPKTAKADALAADAAPDLSMLAEGLRSLAWPVEQLQFHPDNPRRHSSEHIDELAASLRVSGQYKNCVASTRLDPPVMVCGNGTLQAALRLGWSHLAVERLALTEAEERRYLVIDNESAAEPDWDHEKLLASCHALSTANDPVLDKMVADLAKSEGLTPPEDKSTQESGEEPNPQHPTCPACGQRVKP